MSIARVIAAARRPEPEPVVPDEGGTLIIDVDNDAARERAPSPWEQGLFDNVSELELDQLIADLWIEPWQRGEL